MYFLFKNILANQFSITNICCMTPKASTPEKILLFNTRVLVTSKVKGDVALFRVMSDSVFKGHIQKVDGQFTRVSGSSISDEKFSFICEAMM